MWILLLSLLWNVNRAEGAHCVQLSNEVYFTDYADEELAIDIVHFKLTVTNYCTEPIPDLGVTNRSQYVQFYVNDEEDNPLSLYNGVSQINTDNSIKPEQSQSFECSWTLTSDSGIWMRGEEFTVHWKYMEYESYKVKVNLKERTVQSLNQPK